MFCFWNKAPYNFLQQRVSNLLSHELENLDMEVWLVFNSRLQNDILGMLREFNLPFYT